MKIHTWTPETQTTSMTYITFIYLHFIFLTAHHPQICQYNPKSYRTILTYQFIVCYYLLFIEVSNFLKPWVHTIRLCFICFMQELLGILKKCSYLFVPSGKEERGGWFSPSATFFKNLPKRIFTSWNMIIASICIYSKNSAGKD